MADKCRTEYYEIYKPMSDKLTKESQNITEDLISNLKIQEK